MSHSARRVIEGSNSPRTASYLGVLRVPSFRAERQRSREICFSLSFFAFCQRKSRFLISFGMTFPARLNSSIKLTTASDSWYNNFAFQPNNLPA